jgi:hypothetical protein
MKSLWVMKSSNGNWNRNQNEKQEPGGGDW